MVGLDLLAVALRIPGDALTDGAVPAPSALRQASPSCFPGVLMMRWAYSFTRAPSCRLRAYVRAPRRSRGTPRWHRARFGRCDGARPHALPLPRRRPLAVLLHDGKRKWPIGRADRERSGVRTESSSIRCRARASDANGAAYLPSITESFDKTSGLPWVPRIATSSGRSNRSAASISAVALPRGCRTPVVEPPAPPGLPLPDRTPPAPVRARIPCRMHSAPAAPPARSSSSAAPPAATRPSPCREPMLERAGELLARAFAPFYPASTAERAVAPGPTVPRDALITDLVPAAGLLPPAPTIGCSHRRHPGLLGCTGAAALPLWPAPAGARCPPPARARAALGRE